MDAVYKYSESCTSSSSPMLHRRHQQQNQPPLLPLPISKPHQNNMKKINRNTTNQPSLSVRKSSVGNASTRGREKSKYQSSNTMTNRIGPDPVDVPKCLFWNSSNEKCDEMNKIVSPPPSSLPLPTFSLRRKLLFCKSTHEAAGIDAGATDNLRRILRIR